MSILSVFNNPESSWFYAIIFCLLIAVALLSNSDPLYLAGVGTLLVYMILVALGLGGMQLGLIGTLVFLFVYSIYKILDLGGIEIWYWLSLVMLFISMVKVGNTKEESVQ